MLRALGALQLSVLPGLGIPAFFRNEAGWHYLLWQRTPFFQLFDGFLTSRSSMSNAVVSRPLVRILEWLQVRGFGLHASWYVAVNGIFFVLFGLSLFEIALRIGGEASAVAAVLLLAGGYLIVFYPVLNAIHGLQYPLEMFLCTMSLVFFFDAFAGRPRRALPGIATWLLASVSHAASAIVIPLAVAAMALGGSGLPPRRRILVGVLSPLAVGWAFLLERQGVAGGLAAQAGWTAKVQFGLAQFGALGGLTLKPPGGLLLFGAFVHEAARAVLPVRRRGRALVSASLLLAVGLTVVARTAPSAALLVLLTALAVAIVRRPRMWFLYAWTLAGVLLFAATPERNASYTRHFIVPCIVVAGNGLAVMIREFFELPTPWRLWPWIRAWRVERVSFAATVLLIGGVLAAVWLPIPMLSNRVHQARYVGDMGLNFRHALAATLVQLPPNATLGFFEGRSREKEMQSLYGVDYFRRLQPAKSEHYGDFTAMMGRPDVQVRLIDPDAGPWPAGDCFLAVNDWEIERARALCGCEPHDLFVRGRSRVGLFR